MSGKFSNKKCICGQDLRGLEGEQIGTTPEEEPLGFCPTCLHDQVLVEKKRKTEAEPEPEPEP